MGVEHLWYIRPFCVGFIPAIADAITTLPPPPPPPLAPCQRCHPPIGRLSTPSLSFSLRCFEPAIFYVKFSSGFFTNLMLSWAEWGGQRVHPLPSFTSCRFDNSPNVSTLRSAFLSAVGPHSTLPFQMELQLQRQQAQAQRQTLDRLARRPPTTSAPAQVDLLSPRLCSCLFFLYIHCCRVCCPCRLLLSL